MEKEAQIQELIEAMNQTHDRRIYERYLAVKLILQGKTQKEAAEIIGRNEHTVGKYIAGYQASGLEGLVRRTAPGRESKLKFEQLRELKEIIAYQTPVDCGFPARANWTLSLAVQLINVKWNESYTLKGASRLLHSLGLSYTRPTYTLKKADPVKQEKFRVQTFPALKKTDERTNRLSPV
ncbi:transposase [Planococcus antarcticus DSM 14505]|uniref:Transposase n=1 Tax=Planococcus antarcticus DSM 14505 TaxID=1185653 RepID=A0AA87LQV4_9BACL|nr:transposase [Planococcus antarcticus DSM 14505]